MHYLDKPADAPISPMEIEAFKHDISRGQSYKIRIETPPTYEERQQNKKTKQMRSIVVTIENKYPFIVVTDKGTFQYGELLSAIRRYQSR